MARLRVFVLPELRFNRRTKSPDYAIKCPLKREATEVSKTVILIITLILFFSIYQKMPITYIFETYTMLPTDIAKK